MIRPWYWPKNGQPERTEPFTWIIEGKIAASWWPDPCVLARFSKEGIKAIVNTCEFDNRCDIPSEFAYYHINVPDFGVPKDAQIKTFLAIMDEHEKKGEPVVVHCVAGCGRTGQFIVAWAAHAGYITEGVDAVEWIRERRSCCLETEAQMNFARSLVERYR